MAIANVRRVRRFGASSSGATEVAKDLSSDEDGESVDRRKVFVLGCCVQAAKNPRKE